MNTETRILRLEQELQQLRRELRGGAARTANPQGLPPVRLAKISSVCVPAVGTDPTTHPLVYVFGIKFIDGTFTESATVQTLSDDDRDAEEYFAASLQGGWGFDGAIVPVWWLNGRWWIFETGGFLLGKSNAATGGSGLVTVNVYAGTTKGSESSSGNTINAYSRFGAVGLAKWVLCYWVNRNWEVIQAEC
jgi:hypothetical protein